MTDIIHAGSTAWYTDSLASLTDGRIYEMGEQGAVSVQISGTWVGTVSFLQSNDGMSWSSVQMLPVAAPGLVTVASSTGNGFWFGMVPAKYFRAQFSAYTSGTAVVTARAVGDGSVNYSFNSPLGATVPWSYVGTLTPATSSTALKAAVTGQKHHVMSLQVSHDALGAATAIQVKDGSTLLWQGLLQTAATDAGSYTLNFDPPLVCSLSAAANVSFSGATTGNVYVNAQGFTAA